MKIRVIQPGIVSPIYSQAIYHGIAEQIQADDSPVLVILRPENPYICIGLHQEVIGEIDTKFCEEQQLPVIRRHVGGGTVLLDKNQLFFQFIFPKAKAPNQPQKLYPYLLQPVLHTYHYFGIPASLKTYNDIQVSNKKIGGTGAGTINNATVLVGSFLYDFDHQLMSQCINSPSENFRASLEGLLEQSMTTINAQLTNVPNVEELTHVFLDNISESLNMEIEKTTLYETEINAIKLAEIELSDHDWLNEEGKKLVSNGLKIASGIYLLEKTLTFLGNPLTIQIEYKNRKIESIWLESQDKKVQATLIFITAELNLLKPEVIYEELLLIISIAATKLKLFQNADIETLTQEIYKLANFTEY